jgi:hypothetical protein
MKKKILIFSVLTLFSNLQILFAQIPIVNNLCFDEEYTQNISVVSEIDLNTLTILDKLKFKNKSYLKKNHEYLNSSGNATHDAIFTSQENLFPQWYNYPTTIRSDESGLKSYFTTESEYLPDGWTGGLKSQTEHGEYIEDHQNGTRYLFQEYSTKAEQVYETWNQSVFIEGFLPKYIFSYPSSLELQDLMYEGFEVKTSENIIQVSNPSIIVVWDIIKKIIVKQYIESNTIIKTTKTYYEYNDDFETYLIHKVIKTTPGEFENGDCFETISTTTFTNFSEECDDSNIAFRKKETNKTLYEKNLLEIYPNPAIDQLNVSIPDSEFTSTLQISKVSGDIISLRKIEAGVNSSTINISSFSPGIYIIQCQQGNNKYYSKFVKQ